MLTREKIQGCYWGLALGDALGMPIEFNQIDFIRERYGENGIQEPKDWAIWTDDTEMSFAVTNALINLGNVNEIVELDDDIIGRTFAKAFIHWNENPGHAPGNTCKSSVYYLIKNGEKEWRNSGNNDSKGCGTVMRAAPLGIWFAENLLPELSETTGIYHQLLSRISAIQSEVTHGHKAATAAALAGAYAVSLAIKGVSPREMITPIEQFCRNIHPDFQEALKRLKTALEKVETGELTDIGALHFIGKGWVGEEAFAMALYACVREPNDLKGCLRIAVNHSGDSDSVGCIAGSIIGALHGMSIIPQDWIDRLAEKKRMEELLVRVIDFFPGLS